MLALLFLCGCTTRNGYIKIDSPDERIKIEGVSVLTPQGNGWYYKKVTPGKLILGKSGKNKDQSIAGLVALSRLPNIKNKEQFLKLISKQRARKPETNRFEDILNKEILSDEKDVFCVRYHAIYKDYGAKNLPKDADFLIIEDIGIACQHPYNKNIGVTIALSQRTREKNKVSNFKSIANDFIKNAKFIHFNKTVTEQGFTFFKGGKYKKAIESFNLAIADNAKNYSAYFYRGFCYFNQKQYPKAISDFEKAISFKKDYIEAYSNIASAYSQMKKYKKALPYANRAIELGSSLTPEEQLHRELPVTHALRGGINYQLKNYEKTIKDYRYLARIKYKEWYIYNNLVMTIIKHSQNIDKTECLQLLKESQILAKKKYFSYINDTYGDLYLKLGNKEKAFAYFNKAIAQTSDPNRKQKIKDKIEENSEPKDSQDGVPPPEI